MEIFPYFSSWILGVAGIYGLVLLLIPAPYGKFAKDYMPFPLNPRAAWAFEHSAYLILLFGYFKDDQWVHTLPTSNKGWICFVFLIVHFLWRALLSQFVIEYIIKPPNGRKNTSAIIVLMGWIYNPFVGMNFRHMVVEIDSDMKSQDYAFLVLAAVCFLGNVFCDVMLNVWRKGKAPLTPWLGSYLSRNDLSERFSLLIHMGMDCPNYMFEGLEWGFFTLLAFRWEAFWYFIGTVIYLTTRSIWTSHWYNLPDSEPEIRDEEVPLTDVFVDRNSENFIYEATRGKAPSTFNFKLKYRAPARKTIGLVL